MHTTTTVPRTETLPVQRVRPLYRGTQVVWYLVGILEILLAFRFFLKLFGANPQAGFTQFIYSITSLFAEPFLFVFPTSRANGNVVEWSTILAMAVYAVIGWVIVKALVMSKPVTTDEANEKLHIQENL